MNLTFVAANRAETVAVFTAPSKSQAGKVNTVVYDWSDGTAHCDCTGSEYGRTCWHLQEVASAFYAEMARGIVAKFGTDDAALVGLFETARRVVRERTLSGRLLASVACPLDAAVLAEARAVYKARRAASAPAPVVAFPVVERVAA